jgi:hypothetical protein
MKNNRTLIITGVIVLLILIGIGVYASKANAAPPVAPPGPSTPPPTSTNVLDVFNFFKGLFSKKTVSDSGYTQVAPIDDQGCDANGYNAIGVRCM